MRKIICLIALFLIGFGGVDYKVIATTSESPPGIVAEDNYVDVNFDLENVEIENMVLLDVGDPKMKVDRCNKCTYKVNHYATNDFDSNNLTETNPIIKFSDIGNTIGSLVGLIRDEDSPNGKIFSQGGGTGIGLLSKVNDKSGTGKRMQSVLG